MLGVIQTTKCDFKANINAFNQDKTVYLSWKSIDLGDEVPSEAKSYLSYSELKYILSATGDNVTLPSDVDFSDLDEIFADLNAKFDTKILCEKLGITISSISSNQVEFSVNSSINDLYNVIKEVDLETASSLADMVEIIGSAKIILNIRVNVATNLLVKLEAKTEDVKEAIQNSLASDEDIKDANINALDMNYKLEFDYSAKKPTLPNTDDYVSIKDLCKK